MTEIVLPMAESESMPEPMEVAHAKRYGRIVVGDRASNRVVAFDDDCFDVVGSAQASAGIFHMRADAHGRNAYVIMVGVAGDNGDLRQFGTRDWGVMRRARLHPHLRFCRASSPEGPWDTAW